ncbi:TonB-dependent receptor domain-containing protein [Capnocytophaga canimorsus]|uniref:TonB-dependent receptor n=1 Tax=Capnocytophaga canimorsus TaxID=28188 RepID=UPI00385F8882
MKFYTFLLLFSLSLAGFAQGGVVKGMVNSEKKSLEGASLVLENKDYKTGVASGKNGAFQLLAPAGRYTLKVSMLGYTAQEIKIEIQQGQTIEKNIELKEDVLGINEVVVTATKTEMSRKEAPVLVSITNAETLSSVRANTLMEGLVFQPGLRTEVNCQNCGFSQVRINGLEGAYSQILINSRPVFGSLNSIYGLEQIPTSMIQQIEVTRGGGSALFGSNAIAGTINIITKNPTKNEFQGGTTYHLIGGQAKDFVSVFNGSLVSDNFNNGMSFYAMHRKRNAYDANNDGFSEFTQLQNINFGTKLFSEITSRKKIEAEFNVSNEKRRGGNALELPEHEADIAESIKTNLLGGNLNYEYLTRDYKHKFVTYANAQATDSDNYYGAGKDPEGYGITKQKIFVLGGQHTAHFDTNNGTFLLTSGVELKKDDISEKRLRANVLSVNQDVKSLGVFSQADWKIVPQFKVLAGLRMEHLNANLLGKSITVINPRASLLYNISERWISRASYARGFRAPLFYSEDVHSEMIPGEVRRVKLASNLKKETSDSFMASLEYNVTSQNQQLILMLEGFYTILHNPFVYEDAGEENGLAIREKQNRDGALVKGVNLEVKYAPNSKWIMQLGATFQSGKFENKYEPEEGIETDKILRTPDIYGNFTATYKPSENWMINFSGVYTGAMDVPHLKGYITENRLERTKSMFDFGINTNYQIAINDSYKLDLSLGMKNLFNQYQKDFDKGAERDPAYIYGPSLPRTFFAGVKIKM